MITHPIVQVRDALPQLARHRACLRFGHARVRDSACERGGRRAQALKQRPISRRVHERMNRVAADESEKV